ncbi:ABC transporter permease [Variovorax gossypii]
MTRLMNHMRWLAGQAFSRLWLLILAVVLWQALTSSAVISRIFLPPPLDVLEALRAWWASGELGDALAKTLWRMGAGWLLASVCGLALAIFVSFDRRLAALLTPTLEFIRPLPAAAVIPVMVLMLGLSDKTIVAVIAFGSIWPLLLNAISGFRAIDPRLKEVAHTLELTPLQYLAKVALPGALPDIVAGLRLGLTLALILCVVAEMITLNGGIGAEILLASRNFRSAELFAGIALIGAIGYGINAVIVYAERRALRWRGDR